MSGESVGDVESYTVPADDWHQLVWAAAHSEHLTSREVVEITMRARPNPIPSKEDAA